MPLPNETMNDQDKMSESLLANEHAAEPEQVVFLDEVEERLPIDTTGDNEPEGTIHGEKQPNRFRDSWAAILFLGHQVAIFYLAFAWGLPALHYSFNGGGDELREEENIQEFSLNGFLLLCFVSSIGAVLLGTISISFMMRFAQQMIQISLCFSIVCNVLILVSFAMQKLWPGVGLCALMLIVLVFYARAVWHRIPFAASNLQTALTAVQTNGGLVVVSMAMTTLSSLWSLVWLMAVVGVYFKYSDCNEETCETHTSPIAFVALLLSFYWTSAVAKNVMHVTTAGTVGTWWFAPDDASRFCSPAIMDSWYRAATYSLGSICFGSLLTAILEVLHHLCREARRRGEGNALVLCVLQCLIEILERLVEYFNKWAYVYVGLYGYDYITAGKRVVGLFRERGWSTIINDNLVMRAILMMCIVTGGLTGCFGMFLSTVTPWMNDFGDLGIHVAFAFPFVIGLALAVTLFSVVASAVDTVIVSFAEAPLEFERNHPGLYVQMAEAWRLAFPDEFAY